MTRRGRGDGASGRATPTPDSGRPRPAADIRLQGFGPIIDRDSRVLILGSFPSQASLGAGHYYAHPRNQFWPILGELLCEPLSGMPFEDRYRRLLAHRIALWDVIGACVRRGSLDADIRDPDDNDFDALARLGPRLRAVLFNGRTAGRYQARVLARGLRATVLPSTSPAFAGMRYADKLAAWRTALHEIEVKG
jgi:hypoxanthine-DNA glycosylase